MLRREKNVFNDFNSARLSDSYHTCERSSRREMSEQTDLVELWTVHYIHPTQTFVIDEFILLFILTREGTVRSTCSRLHSEDYSESLR